MPSVAQWSLDVAADSQEELQDWVKKIREVAQTADARVRTCHSLEGAAWLSLRSTCGPAWEPRPLTPQLVPLEKVTDKAWPWIRHPEEQTRDRIVMDGLRNVDHEILWIT